MRMLYVSVDDIMYNWRENENKIKNLMIQLKYSNNVHARVLNKHSTKWRKSHN